MDLRRLEYFLAVAEELNFGRAASRLNITQPSLSQQIHQLEKELECTLFDRSSRPIRLTIAGQILKDDALELLTEAENTAREVRRAGRGEVGRIRLGYSHGGLYDLALTVLKRVREQRPSATVVIRQVAERDQLPALRAHRVDFVLGRLTEPPTSDVVVHDLCGERLIVILPECHRLASWTAVPLAELAEEHFVMFPRRLEPIVFDNYLGACVAAGFHMQIAYEVTEAQTQALAIAAGLGVGLSGDHLALRFPGVVYRPVEPATTIATIAVLWSVDGMPEELRSLLDELPALAAQAASPSGSAVWALGDNLAS